MLPSGNRDIRRMTTTRIAEREIINPRRNKEKQSTRYRQWSTIQNETDTRHPFTLMGSHRRAHEVRNQSSTTTNP